VENLGSRVTFALAGRSEDKLRARWKEVTSRHPTTYEPGFIACDLKDPVTIRSMVIKARVVVNIAGPFMLTPADMLVREDDVTLETTQTLRAIHARLTTYFVNAG